MAADVSFIVNVIYPAASSAYTIMNVPTPPLVLPPGYQLVGPINANPQRAAAAMQAAAPAQQRIAATMLAESSIFGLIAWNAAQSTALVAIRGTQTIWEWIEDLDAAPVPYIPNPGAGLVHMGFQLVYEHIRDDIAQKLQASCAGVKRMLVTGHSLGAAVAVLCGFDIAKNLNLGPVPELNTFAGPRAGAPDFANSFNQLIPVCNRVVNFMDVVPQVPLPPLYQHVGAELLVQGGFKPLDVTYAHHLTTYLAGLQKLLPPPPQS